MAVNWDEGIDNHGGSDNHSQVEFGNEGVNDYHDNWGGGGGADLRR